MKFIVTDRANDVHVCVEGHEEIWGCGACAYSAIGNMVMNHPNFFKIEIDDRRAPKE